MIQLSLVEIISYTGLLAGFLFAVIRLIKGPSLNDRVLALDLMANITSAFVLVYIFITGITIYLDAVVVISLISFLGSVGVSMYFKEKTLWYLKLSLTYSFFPEQHSL